MEKKRKLELLKLSLVLATVDTTLLILLQKKIKTNLDKKSHISKKEEKPYTLHYTVLK